MAAGLGLLGHAPDVFWAMSPRELEAALGALAAPGTPRRPPSRPDLAALMARFPDINKDTP